MRIKLIAITLLLLASVGTAQTPTTSDPWESFKAFVGIWEGVGNGQPGMSKEYRFVLNDKYIQVQNKSTYNPQPKILGPDEFLEVFEIAEPGKDFELLQ